MPTASAPAIGTRSRRTLRHSRASGTARPTTAGPSRKCTNCAPSKYVLYDVPRRREHRDDQRDGDQHGIGERMHAAARVAPPAGRVHDERQREPRERRRGEVDPQLEERFARHRRRSAGASRCARARADRATANVSAVAAIASTVLTTMRHDDRQPLGSICATCSITPTPAGTNSSDRCLREPVGRDASSHRARGRARAAPTSSSAMPSTGPGTGSAGEPHQRLAGALEQQQPREAGE